MWSFFLWYWAYKDYCIEHSIRDTPSIGEKTTFDVFFHVGREKHERFVREVKRDGVFLF